MVAKRRQHRKGSVFWTLMRCGMCRGLSALGYIGRPARYEPQEICVICADQVERAVHPYGPYTSEYGR